MFTRTTLIARCCILGVGSRLYLLLFAVLGHETFVADVGEEEALVDGDVGDVLVGGGVGGALVGVPFPTHMGIATLLLVLPLLFLLLPLLVLAPVTITRHWIFSNKMTGLTTFVAHPFGAGFVVLPPPLLEDLAEALDDCHTRFLEGKPNANHVRARISYSRTQQLHNMDIITQCSK
jgi:hypothetical protein